MEDFGWPPGPDCGTSEKRKLIEYLNEQTDDWESNFGFFKNELIKVENQVLIVPLDMSIFGKDVEPLIQKIEENWSVYGLKVRIVNNLEGYKVNVPAFVFNNHVNHRKKEINLKSPVSLRSLLHEFGHVLGLSDTYYSFFNQNGCTYIYELHNTDIMSGSRSGLILPEHIEQIKAAYGL